MHTSAFECKHMRVFDIVREGTIRNAFNMQQYFVFSLYNASV